jgi:hypothetical protein
VWIVQEKKSTPYGPVSVPLHIKCENVIPVTLVTCRNAEHTGKTNQIEKNTHVIPHNILSYVLAEFILYIHMRVRVRVCACIVIKPRDVGITISPVFFT